MTDPLAHLQRPEVVGALAVWERHVEGCAQCQDAPGPPPPDVRPEDRVLYACSVGLELHELAVQAAARAYREAGDGWR